MLKMLKDTSVTLTRTLKIFSCVSVIVCSTSAHADLPLTMEDLTAEKNRFKLETKINYFNKNDTSYGQDATNTTMRTDSNLDALFANVGLKYGLTDRLEIGTRMSGYTNKQRTSTHFGESESNNDSGFSRVNLNSQYQLITKHDTLPDSLIFVDVAAYDKSLWLTPAYVSSVSVGGSVHTINDPIALSINGLYQYNGDREIQTTNAKLDVGDVTSLTASVSFAVNPDISLVSGIGWQSRQANKLIKTDTKMGYRQTKTSLNFGVAYAVSERSNLTANINTDISGKTGSMLGLKLTTKLGQLKTPLSEQYRQKITP